MIMSAQKLALRLVPVLGWIFLLPLAAQEHWHSHAEVVRKVMDKFESMNTYRAGFSIATTDGRINRNLNGSCYFQKPGKIRFDFSEPAGNLIVSDGRILWIYIRRLNIAGKQDLRLDVKNENDASIFSDAPGPGLARLFRKYHYRFDSENQPRQEEGGNYFVLDMDQREKIGGYEKIKLYVDAGTFLIHKAVASDSYGKKTTITFLNPAVNSSLDGALFKYEPNEGIRQVNNPLVNE